MNTTTIVQIPSGRAALRISLRIWLTQLLWGILLLSVGAMLLVAAVGNVVFVLPIWVLSKVSFKYVVKLSFT